MEQLSLRVPRGLRAQLKARALRENRDESVVAREALERGLADKGPAKHGLAELMALRVTGGPTDLSSRIDDYLYGDGE